MAHWQFHTTCVDSTAELIDAMTDHPSHREIGYDEFVKLVGFELLRETFPDYDWSRKGDGLTLKKDYHVRYHRSEFGLEDEIGPCAYIVHSATEYVFLPDNHPLTGSRLRLTAA